MKQKNVVKLLPTQRKELKRRLRGGKGKVLELRRARILLLADVKGPGWADGKIAEALNCSPLTVGNVRRYFVERGFKGATCRKKQATPSNKPLLDGCGEARLIALACSETPEGQARWTLRLLAQRAVELEIAPQLSYESVRRTLKKNELKPHLKQQWCIPPKEDAAFVAAMEDVLDVYRRPFDPRYPVVNMDEQPFQRLDHTRNLIPMKPGQPEREDYEYERNGTACIFLFTDALGKWRRVSARERRTAIDWAEEMRQLLEEDYPDVEKVILVCDNLNTHCAGSFYKAFPPDHARRLLRRLEIHFTPKHGSWLNIAECELSALTRQCLNRRIPDLPTLSKEVKAWEHNRNSSQKGVEWRFSTKDARIRLKSLYPKTQL